MLRGRQGPVVLCWDAMHARSINVVWGGAGRGPASNMSPPGPGVTVVLGVATAVVLGLAGPRRAGGRRWVQRGGLPVWPRGCRWVCGSISRAVNRGVKLEAFSAESRMRPKSELRRRSG